MKGSKKIEIPARRSNGEPKASIVRTIIQIFRERERGRVGGNWAAAAFDLWKRKAQRKKRRGTGQRRRRMWTESFLSLSLSLLGKRGTCAGMWTIFFIYLFFPPLHVMWGQGGRLYLCCRREEISDSVLLSLCSLRIRTYVAEHCRWIWTVDLLCPAEQMGSRPLICSVHLRIWVDWFFMEPLLKGGNGDHRFFKFHTSDRAVCQPVNRFFLLGFFFFNNKRFFIFFLFFFPFFFFLYSRFGWIEKSRTFERPSGFSNVVGQGLYDCMDKSWRSASQDSLSWGHLERPPFLSWNTSYSSRSKNRFTTWMANSKSFRWQIEISTWAAPSFTRSISFIFIFFTLHLQPKLNNF